MPQRRNARATNAEIFSRRWRRSLPSSSRSMGRSASSPSGPRPTFPGKATKAISAIADVVSSWIARRKFARRLRHSHRLTGSRSVGFNFRNIHASSRRAKLPEHGFVRPETRTPPTAAPPDLAALAFGTHACMRCQGRNMLLLAVLRKCWSACPCYIFVAFLLRVCVSVCAQECFCCTIAVPDADNRVPVTSGLRGVRPLAGGCHQTAKSCMVG